jgi:hypothetical protein
MTQPNLPARVDELRHRILDGLNHVVDTIELQSAKRAAVHAALFGEIAALTCRKMACRRAHRCRGKPLACLKRARAYVKSSCAEP